MKKRLLCLVLVLAMVMASFTACGSKDTTLAETNDGKVFRIYCWNTEFQERFNDYFVAKGLVPDGITVEWVITPSENLAYQDKLDAALLAQGTAAADDKIDMFLVEADYAIKYVGTDYTLDVREDVGLTDTDLAQQYKYTQDVVTDDDGALKGVTWQACPQGFLYRRSYALEVLGTDDPDEVQNYISTWAKFDETAVKMKDAGYYMLSGFDDAYRVYSNNASQAWVNSDNEIVVDDQILAWIKQTKDYTDKGYNNKASLWSAESQAGMGADGKVFGYFGPAWFMDFCFMQYTLADSEAEAAVGNGSWGDWGMAKGPVGSFWGGTWICGCDGTDNIELVKLVMQTMTCDKDTLVQITNDKGDFTNNVAAMTELANSDYGYAFLGGQNHIATLLQSAQDINISGATGYDQTMTEKLQAAFKDYFNGIATEAEAWDTFYKAVIEKHPELKRVN